MLAGGRPLRGRSDRAGRRARRAAHGSRRGDAPPFAGGRAGAQAAGRPAGAQPSRSGTQGGVLAAPEGLVVSVVKVFNETYPPPPDRFKLESPLQAGPGPWGNITYFGGRDGYAYGYNVVSSRVLWRQLLGSAVTRTPVTTDLDLYMVTQREGMSRLDRETGRPLWTLPRGNRVLSYNIDAERPSWPRI